MYHLISTWNIRTTYSLTGKSLSEANIFASTNPQYDNRLFIELQVQYMKIPSSNLRRTCCVQKLFLTFRTYTTCSPHVLQKEELLTKIYLYQNSWKTCGTSNSVETPLWLHEGPGAAGISSLLPKVRVRVESIDNRVKQNRHQN